jgi:septum formation protein
MKIVLASESQFRRRALDLLGLAYEICPSGIDEKAIRDNNPAELTRKLAEAKARKVASECPEAVVVSGDAVVSKGDRIYEKAGVVRKKRLNSSENSLAVNSSL